MFIVKYQIRIVGNKFSWYWIRSIDTPNTRNFATRFESIELANQRMDQIMRNMGSSGWLIEQYKIMEVSS